MGTSAEGVDQQYPSDEETSWCEDVPFPHGYDRANLPERTCPHHNQTQGRNLVLCFDGTSNKYGKKVTNVIEAYDLFEKDENQLVYYTCGIGTFAWTSYKSMAYVKEVILSKIDLVVALRFEKAILDAYGWLVREHKSGDRIFLFGFSRGAYQARALAAMIKKVGLLHRGLEGFIPFAYNFYRRKQKNAGHTDDFKQRFSTEDITVHFVGAWDSVCSVGASNKHMMGTTKSNVACYFRHALAMDERRVKFLPLYVCGGAHYPPERKTDPATPNEDPGTANVTRLWPRVKEVWFAGCHSDVGGNRPILKVNKAASSDVNENRSQTSSYSDEDEPQAPTNGKEGEPQTISDIPFLWLLHEGKTMGLRLKDKPMQVDLVHIKTVTPDESMKGILWKLSELVPFWRLSYRDHTHRTMMPNFYRGRTITQGQRVHISVALIKGYVPKARFHPSLNKDTTAWSNIMGKPFHTSGIFNLDMFDPDVWGIGDMLDGFREESPRASNTLDVLTMYAWTADGTNRILRDHNASSFLLAILNEDNESSRGTLCKLVVNDANGFILHDDDFIEKIEKLAFSKSEGGKWLVHLLWTMARKYGEFWLPFLDQDQELEAIDPQYLDTAWFKSLCLAAIQFARFLEVKHQDTLQKAQNLLDQLSISKAPPIVDAAIRASQATVYQAEGTQSAVSDAVVLRKALLEQNPDEYSYEVDLAYTLLHQSILRLTPNSWDAKGSRAWKFFVTRSDRKSMSMNAMKLGHAKACVNLANRLHDLGERKEALKFAQRSVKLFEEVFPTNVDPAMATALSNLSEYLFDDGNHDDAVNRLQQAVDILRDLSHTAPTKHRLDLSLSLVHLSRMRLRHGPEDAALEACREVVAICPKLSTAGLAKRCRLAESLYHLARELKANRHYKSALKPAQESIRLYEQLVDNTLDSLTRLEASYLLLADCYGTIGHKFKAAEAREAADKFREHIDPRQRQAGQGGRKF